MSILFLSGSPSATSRSAHLLAEVRRRLDARDEDSAWVAIRDLPADALVLAQAQHPAIQAAIAEVERAHAVVIASPIYKAAYSGLLKLFLDLLPQKALEGKLVLPVSTAGSALHVLALDFTIRPVLAALGVREVIPPVSALDSQVEVQLDGSVRFDRLIQTRLDDTLNLLLERLRSQDRELLLRAQQASAPVPFSAVQYSV